MIFAFCSSAELITIESGLSADHYGWSVEDAFLDDGGWLEDVDAPAVDVRCPGCPSEGPAMERSYAFSLVLETGFAYETVDGTITQSCPEVTGPQDHQAPPLRTDGGCGGGSGSSIVLAMMALGLALGRKP